MMNPQEKEKIEMELLLTAISKRYGYDFSNYSVASLKRRLKLSLSNHHLSRYTELLDLLFHDEKAFDEFLRHMSITVTEMFRDPKFYDSIRTNVVPLLKTYPFVKIWHAGCATGEEVYSMAILLHEEGFLERVRIYATDFNKHSLAIAEQGVYPDKILETYEKNYLAAGGKGNFSQYYGHAYERLKFKDFLKESITFSYHNLVTDGVFGEMHLICCRNVLIYFDKILQERVRGLFMDSLRHGGFLCLGAKESLRFSEVQPFFNPIDEAFRIYQRTG